MCERHRLLARPLPVAIFIIFIWPGTVWAQDSIHTAQGLYASAAYHEALAVLDRLMQAAPPPADARLIEQHRALCLLALGRVEDAETAIAAVVSADPSYRPDEAHVSPRVIAAFRDVRGRLLPQMIQVRYRDARRFYDEQDWPRAIKAFGDVGALAGDPDVVDNQTVADYVLLAGDFRRLAEAASALPPAPPPPPEPESAVVGLIYDASHADVVAPVALVQQLPRWPSAAISPPEAGLLEIVIDEAGAVEQASVIQPMSPLYDQRAVEAARSWRYEPAARAGHPVRFRKVIRVEFK